MKNAPRRKLKQRSETFFVPWVGPSFNIIWAGVHWSKRKKIATAGKQETWEALRSAGIKDTFQHPVNLVFTPVIGPKDKGTKRDATNYIVATKVIEDALVTGKILEDDAPEYVYSIKIMAPEIGEQKGMRVKIYEQEYH